MTPNPELRLPVIARRLQDAHDFIGVAKVVCELGPRLFGLHQCAVMLHASSGRPVLAVDNVPNVPDEQRLAYLDELWMTDPYLRALREHHVPIGEELLGQGDSFVHTFVLPIFGDAGLVGSIRCGHLQAFTAALARELTVLATHVSVRLAHLGVVPAGDPTVISRLTARQLDVAQLTALGWTNAEIARLLGMSENTVKKHLKDVFVRVEIDNRTELAVLLARVAPRDKLAAGVTHVDGVAISKAAA